MVDIFLFLVFIFVFRTFQKIYFKMMYPYNLLISLIPTNILLMVIFSSNDRDYGFLLNMLEFEYIAIFIILNGIFPTSSNNYYLNNILFMLFPITIFVNINYFLILLLIGFLINRINDNIYLKGKIDSYYRLVDFLSISVIKSVLIILLNDIHPNVMLRIYLLIMCNYIIIHSVQLSFLLNDPYATVSNSEYVLSPYYFPILNKMIY
jgi:hypothetical protein